MKQKLEKLDTKQLLYLYEQHTETFYLPYCNDKEIKISEYNFRSTILEILKERLEEDMK